MVTSSVLSTETQLYSLLILLIFENIYDRVFEKSGYLDYAPFFAGPSVHIVVQ